MSAGWIAVIALAAGTALIKATGAALGGRQNLPPVMITVLRFLPPALLAGLIVTETFTAGSHQLGIDARAAGLAAAGVAVFFRAPMLVVIIVAVVVTAVSAAVA